MRLMSESIRIGMTVRAADGEAGSVDDILVDANGTRRFLVIRDRGVFGADVVLPFASVTVSGGTVNVAMTKREIHAADHFSADRYGQGAGLFSVAAARYDKRAE
jgi:PRC-barrel domain